ncbi:MAG: hypothetical protein GY845_26270 [Planctomycetes bacterium]|nr:hypothetical protein [Planctomycetota bacterium]
MYGTELEELSGFPCGHLCISNNNLGALNTGFLMEGGRFEPEKTCS